MQVTASSNREPEPLALDAFERLGAFVLRMEDAPDAVELSVALVDDDEIAHLNEQYRGIAGPTDVLSFGCDDPCPTASDEPIAIGDVIIAPEVARRQAAELGTTVEDELDLLLVHGILHLLGYDHDTDADAAVMQARERTLLAAWSDAGR
ncbi:MAG TPA: rRNA maturation RNase YbeY [Coriobacteriia bacterium]